jgi:hypothetical protein
VSSPLAGDDASGSLFPENRPDIPTDDWDDQDLLTKDEAALRLEHSADLIRGQLAEASDPAVVAELEEQIARIERVLANIRR